MNAMNKKHLSTVLLPSILASLLFACTGGSRPEPDEPFLIRKKQNQGLVSGLWYYDEERGLARMALR